jgi:putative Mg2+ transporter-C (MgtC) family protein
VTEWEALLRIGVAAVLGGLIGFERESLDKSAGLRTHMLVSVGAALFMTASLLLARDFSGAPEGIGFDPSRIPAAIVTGIGFLGGGLILKERRRVRGLTTAAGLWVTAAIGLSTGAGYYIAATGTVVMVLIILVVLRPVEARANRRMKQNGTRAGDDKKEMSSGKSDAEEGE